MLTREAVSELRNAVLHPSKNRGSHLRLRGPRGPDADADVREAAADVTRDRLRARAGGVRVQESPTRRLRVRNRKRRCSMIAVRRRSRCPRRAPFLLRHSELLDNQ